MDDAKLVQVSFGILHCQKLERLCRSDDGHRSSQRRNTTDNHKRGMRKRGLRWKRPFDRDRDLMKRGLRWNDSPQKDLRRSRTRYWNQDATPHMKQNATPHWHRDDRRGYPTLQDNWRDRAGVLWQRTSGEKPHPNVPAVTAADNVFQKDMETSEAEEESSCAKGGSKEATEASVDATDAWA